MAYLVGYREFYSLPFRVTPDVLIPRPETELLVVRLLDLAKQRQRTGGAVTIADVGTGSGIIAVCAAKHIPEARVTAIDISPSALAVARAMRPTTASPSGSIGRGDLLAAVSDRQFDFIVSNPPYVSEAEYAALPTTVRDFEPQQALLAGPRGTEVIERLVPQAAERLAPGGWLLIEISPMIEAAAFKLLAAEPTLEPAPTIKDLSGLAHIVQARKRA